MEVGNLNPSLVKPPTEWFTRKDEWRRLTSAGLLPKILKHCLRQPDSGEKLQQVLAHLAEWEEFASDPSNFRAGKHQWRAAQELTNLALRASTQPRSSSTDKQPIDRIFFRPKLSAWQWDAVCALQSTPRIAVKDTKRSISVLMEQGSRGYLARLDVELIADGNGETYPDPESNWFVEFEPETFLKAASDLWGWIKSEFDASDQQQLQKVDARFRLARINVPDYATPELDSVSGGSAQAAFYLCLLQAAEAYLGKHDALLLDPSVAASATLSETARLASSLTLQLGGVFALESKMKAAYLNVLSLVIVASCNETEAKSELESAKASRTPNQAAGAVEVIGCQTIADALALLRDRAKEKEAVRRYEHDEKRSQLQLLDQSVPIERLYQVLPLLREVKKERLQRSKNPTQRDGEEDSFTGWRGSGIQRWEEALCDEHIYDEQYALAKVFTDFRGIVREPKSDVPRFIVLGPPGSGKSTLEQFLAWACGATCNGENGNEDTLHLREASGIAANLVPARVTLRDWEQWATKSSDPEQSLAEYLAEQYKELGNAPTAEHWLTWMHRGEVLLLLDGLDEIGGEASFVVALKTTLARFKECPTVLTCRTVSFEQHRALDSDLPVFAISGLNNEQRDAFVRTYPAKHADSFDCDKLIDQLDRSLQMRPLSANPLLLSIICYVVDSSKVMLLPATRGELYNEAIDRLLERNRGEKVNYPNPLPLIRKRRIVERAALTLFAGMEEQRQLNFDQASLVDALTLAAQEEYGDAPALMADALLVDLEKNSGILRGDPRQGYFFLHLTIQEFLAASAIARVVNNKKNWQAEIRLTERCVTPHQIVDRKSWDAQWSEVIKLFAGQLQDPAPLLNLLADEKEDDDFRHRLALAAMCLPEIMSMTRNAQATSVNHITDTAFSCWLKQHQAYTREFPHLARALLSLGQVNGYVKDVPLLTVLSNLLRDANGKEGFHAAVALGRLGDAAAKDPEVLQALVEVVLGDTDGRDSRDSRVPHFAVMALGRIGSGTSQSLVFLG